MLLQALPRFVYSVYYFGYDAHNQNKYCSVLDSFKHTFSCVRGSTLKFTIMHLLPAQKTLRHQQGVLWEALFSKVQLCAMRFLLGYELCIGDINTEIFTYMLVCMCVTYRIECGEKAAQSMATTSALGQI